MTKWSHKLSAITLFVDDLEAAKRFYEQVFDVPKIFEDDSSAVFDFGNTLINLLAAPAVPELIEPAHMAPAAAGASMQLTLEVNDVDAVASDLQARGVKLLNGPMDRPWGIRTAAFQDPAGHIWEIAAN